MAHNRTEPNNAGEQRKPLPLTAEELFLQTGKRTPDFVIVIGFLNVSDLLQ